MFDLIQLPEGYEKVYIEWILPKEETFEEYTRKMAETIDVREPFILIGYSMGGTIVQEMNTFLQPEKTSIISSIKAVEEIPHLFRIVKKTRINNRLPQRLYKINKKISDLFAHQIFPFTLIQNAISVEGGDHIMIIRKAEAVNRIINCILSLI